MTTTPTDSIRASAALPDSVGSAGSSGVRRRRSPSVSFAGPESDLTRNESMMPVIKMQQFPQSKSRASILKHNEHAKALANSRRQSNSLPPTIPEEISKEPERPLHLRVVECMLDSWVTFVILSLITIVALFLPDFHTWYIPKSADHSIDIVYLVVCFLLIGEVVCNSLVFPQYFGRLFFWLDLVAALSVLLEVSFVNPIDLEGVAVARAGRAARTGARAGRITKLTRLIRVARLTQFLGFSSKSPLAQRVRAMSRGHGPTLQSLKAQASGTHQKESVVWKKISEKTTTKVVLAVLFMLMVIPLFNISEIDNSAALGTSQILSSQAHGLFQNTTARRQQIMEFVDFMEGTTTPVVFLEFSFLPAPFCHRERDLARLRKSEVLTIESIMEDLTAKVVLSDKYTQVHSAKLEFAKTLFVIVFLAVLSFLFARDANRLVVAPIERIVETITLMSLNPLAKVGEEPKQAANETQFIEQALKRIYSLLQLGFGEAGAEIISGNISQEGLLTSLRPGSRVEAIFGFCDIRKFTSATEYLQENVMLFVNSIAEIVHQCVHDGRGAANKNIGDAFLVVWKLSGEQQLARREKAYHNLADEALRSFIRVIFKVQQSSQLEEIILQHKLREKLGSDYEVTLGFGLHVGWAIEGGIGSRHKIDASYLSPHVNMAARLESATKQYGVQILMSGDFVERLSPFLRPLCRKIDCVLVQGSTDPVTLYTYDVYAPAETPSFDYTVAFAQAIEEYLQGNWERAAAGFRRCLSCWDDGPARTLLAYIESKKCVSPTDWAGYRQLDSK